MPMRMTEMIEAPMSASDAAEPPVTG